MYVIVILGYIPAQPLEFTQPYTHLLHLLADHGRDHISTHDTLCRHLLSLGDSVYFKLETGLASHRLNLPLH